MRKKLPPEALSKQAIQPEHLVMAETERIRQRILTRTLGTLTCPSGSLNMKETLKK